MIPVIEEHFRQHRQKLVKLMTFRAGSPEAAEDIVQEAFYRALRYHRSCRPEEFNNWFNAIMFNALRDYKREEAGRSEDEFVEGEEEGQPCPAFHGQVEREVHALIAAKPDVQREVLELHVQHGFTARDIADITPHSYANCHKIIQRFREELRAKYW